MLKIVIAGMCLAIALSAGPLQASEDQRQLVEMPPRMQEHMLGNMRDHLVALEEILAALSEGDAGKAGAVAEKRLGMSSLGAHGASHMAPYMPEGMREAGSGLHRAASRFVLAAEDAAVTQTPEAQRSVFKALSDVTAQCNACHSAYRIR